MLFKDLKVGESVSFQSPNAPRVLVTLREKNGTRARLEIDAEKSVKIEHHRATANIAVLGITRPLAVKA